MPVPGDQHLVAVGQVVLGAIAVPFAETAGDRLRAAPRRAPEFQSLTVEGNAGDGEDVGAGSVEVGGRADAPDFGGLWVA